MTGLMVAISALALVFFVVNRLDASSKKMFTIKWKYPLIIGACASILVGGLFDYLSYRRNADRNVRIAAQLTANLNDLTQFEKSLKNYNLSRIKFEKIVGPLEKILINENLVKLHWSVGNETRGFGGYPIILSNKSVYHVNLERFESGYNYLSYKERFYTYNGDGDQSLKYISFSNGNNIISPGSTVKTDRGVISVGRPYRIKADINVNPFSDKYGNPIDFSEIAIKSNAELISLKKEMKDSKMDLETSKLKVKSSCGKSFKFFASSDIDSAAIDTYTKKLDPSGKFNTVISKCMNYR